MADRVLQRLQEEDEELCTYLIRETRKNITSDPREFLLNFIHTEKEKAMLAEREELGNSFESLPSDAKELLFHPAMFIRKWIGEVCSEINICKDKLMCITVHSLIFDIVQILIIIVIITFIMCKFHKVFKCAGKV